MEKNKTLIGLFGCITVVQSTIDSNNRLELGFYSVAMEY